MLIYVPVPSTNHNQQLSLVYWGAGNKTKVFHAEHVFAKTMRSCKNAVVAYARGEQITLLKK